MYIESEREGLRVGPCCQSTVLIVLGLYINCEWIHSFSVLIWQGLNDSLVNIENSIPYYISAGICIHARKLHANKICPLLANRLRFISQSFSDVSLSDP